MAMYSLIYILLHTKDVFFAASHRMNKKHEGCLLTFQEKGEKLIVSFYDRFLSHFPLLIGR